MRGGLRAPTMFCGIQKMKSVLFFSAIALLVPSSVAAKYVEDKTADVMLAKKIREGGVGVWGQVPMPAQAQVTEAEALTLARWILELK